MPLRSSSASVAVVPIPSQRFLVPPSDRFKFTVLFTLATGLGWLLTWAILHTPQGAFSAALMAQPGLLSAFVVGFVSGLVVSAAQWVVLRYYVPDWLWILAGATGYVLLTLTLEAWWGWVGQVLSLPEVAALVGRWSPVTLSSFSVVVRTVLATLAALWLGLMQWLFLRQYASSGRWWIVVPSMAVILSAFFSAFGVGLLWLGVRLPLEVSVLAAGVLGTTQAIALCCLERRYHEAAIGASTHPLTTAPELVNYGQVQTLKQQLSHRLNMAWTSDYLNEVPLTFLVGVTQTGAIAAFLPTNAPAMEQIDQIPLPELLAADQSRVGPEPLLARFEVAFLPSGGLKVVSVQGVPLGWVVVSMGITVIAVSAIAAYLLTFLPN